MKNIILKLSSSAILSDDCLAPKSTKASSQSQKHPFSVFFFFLFYQITSNDFSSRAWAETTLASILAGANINKTISDGGITVDFSFIKVHTSN